MRSKDGIRSDDNAPIQVVDARGHGFRLLDDVFIDVWLPCLSGVQVKVYLYLLRHAWGSRDAFPSTLTIARKIGHTQVSVCVSLHTLVELKLVAKTRRTGALDRDDVELAPYTYTLLPVPALTLAEAKAIRDENEIHSKLEAAEEEQAQQQAEPELFDAEEVPAKKPRVPSHVASSSTHSTAALFDETDYKKLVTDFLLEVERLNGGIVNWAFERRAANNIVRIACKPTLEELVRAYTIWHEKRDPQYGYSLAAFSKSVGRMIVDARSEKERPTRNPMRESAEKYAQRARGLFDG